MNDRVVIVPQSAEILQDPNTETLHTYPNGMVLIRTSAPVSESSESPEMPLQRGVQLTDVSDADLAEARRQLNIILPEFNSKASIAPETEAQIEAGIAAEEVILAYVELIGSVDPQWLRQLKQLGIQPLRYQPEHSYLCRGQAIAFGAALHQSFVLHITPLTEAMKPQVVVMAEDGEDVMIVVQGDRTEIPGVLQELGTIPGVELERQPVEAIDFYLRIRARVTPEGQATLLKRSRVMAVERYEVPHPEDEVAGLILAGQYDAVGKPNGSFLRWLEDHGINGEGITIGIVDNGVDVSHSAFTNRIKDLTDGKKSWHGTGVAGHAAGSYLIEKDPNQFIYGVGMAPNANLLIQDNMLSATALCKQTVTELPPSGIAGSVQNNSWGKGTRNPMDYGSDEAIYDQLVRNADPGSATPKPLTICFSSGNSGSAGLTRPKAAKNLIITGNSKSYRPDRGRDQSNNIRQIYDGPHASSWGNCGDGRIRPHVVAPGEWTATANYDSHEGDPEYISPQLTFVGGSSAASPKTAGACALLVQWWRRHNQGNSPSPAMLRALIVNGADPIDAGGCIPNNIQGWGRLNLENILSEAVPHVYVDQSVLLSQLGEQKTWNIRVANPQAPVKVTLNYTDPPGPIGSGGQPKVSPIVNKLALRVEVNGTLYRANQFQNGWSYANGVADAEGSDNLQNVYLPAGTATETLKVTITAINITTNCLTGAIDTPQQDFALVITNGQFDVAATPADVFVAVDPKAKSNTPASQPDDHWKDNSGNNDAHDLGTDQWKKLNPANPPAPPPIKKPSSEEDWWNQADIQWSKPETDRQRENSSSITDTSFVRGMNAGIDLLINSGGNQVKLANGTTSETDRTGEVPPLVDITPESDRASATQSPVPPELREALIELSTALHQLILNWEQFGASNESVIRRRVAVLVVGAGTRIDLIDLAILRRLAFLGTLYLLSDDAVVLAFLAQRIHRRQNIEFRLATSADELAQLVRDTLAEVGGMQPVGMMTQTEATSAGLISKYAFNLLDRDRHLTIRLRYPLDAPMTALQLQRPGQPSQLIDLQNPGSEIHLIQQPGVLQLELDTPSNGQNWSGLWTLQLVQPPVDLTKTASVNLWVRSALSLNLTAQAESAIAAGREHETLITLNSNADISLTRSLIKLPRIVTSHPQPTSESEKEIVLTAPTSRLSREIAATESSSNVETETLREQTASATLSQWLALPKSEIGARILDFPVQVMGLDRTGNPFARMVRKNLIDLEPRSQWRQRMSEQNSVEQNNTLFIAAKIIEVRYDNGKVIGLRLRKGDRQRNVAVLSPVLQAEIAQIDLETLRTDIWHFGVVGNELVGLIRSFDGKLPF